MKKYRYLILAVSLLFLIVLCALLTKPILDYMQDPAAFTLRLQALGPWGPIVFMCLNILQVLLALIPGGPFEIAAGALWGPVWGTLLCDLSMSIGGVITFLLVRRFGMSFIELFTTKEKIESVRFLKANDRSVFLLFLFFLLPGTPKDLMCYVVGLSNIPLPTWIVINLIGRFPAILLSALSGSAFTEARYEIFVLMFIILLLLYVIGTYLYRHHNRKE